MLESFFNSPKFWFWVVVGIVFVMLIVLMVQIAQYFLLFVWTKERRDNESQEDDTKIVFTRENIKKLYEKK